MTIVEISTVETACSYLDVEWSRQEDEAVAWMFDAPPNVAVFTTRSVVCDGAWIAHVFHDADDGGWQFHDNAPGSPLPEDAMVVALSTMVLRDGTLSKLADLPEGWRAWRDGPAAPWQRGKIG